MKEHRDIAGSVRFHTRPLMTIHKEYHQILHRPDLFFGSFALYQANWNFGTDGDARIYPGRSGYRSIGWVLGDNGLSHAAGLRNRARCTRIILHGVLARGLRGNWYSPLNADPSGHANLQFYGILAQQPVL